MAKKKEPTAGKSKKPVNLNHLFLRLDDETGAALAKYVDAQDVPPERTAVGIKALRAFLAERGYLPKPGK